MLICRYEKRSSRPIVIEGDSSYGGGLITTRGRTEPSDSCDDNDDIYLDELQQELQSILHMDRRKTYEYNETSLVIRYILPPVTPMVLESV